MPTFYLNIRAIDRYIPDPEGHDYPTLDEARHDALRAAREMLSDAIRSGKSVDGQQFQITDAKGSLCAVVPFREAIRLQ